LCRKSLQCLSEVWTVISIKVLCTNLISQWCRWDKGRRSAVHNMVRVCSQPETEKNRLAMWYIVFFSSLIYEPKYLLKRFSVISFNFRNPIIHWNLHWLVTQKRYLRWSSVQTANGLQARVRIYIFHHLSKDYFVL